MKISLLHTTAMVAMSAIGLANQANAETTIGYCKAITYHPPAPYTRMVGYAAMVPQAPSWYMGAFSIDKAGAKLMTNTQCSYGCSWLVKNALASGLPRPSCQFEFVTSVAP